VLSFIVVFGVTKALTNYLAGRLSDRFGRKQMLVGGWLVAIPVPFLLMWAPSWNWVLFANALLGVSQGLTWSTTVIMKIDLAGPARRGWRWASTSSPATSRSPAPRWRPAGSPRATACGPSRSTSASASSRSASACRCSWCARPSHHVAAEARSTAPRAGAR
jgi:hypothetical protein